MSTKKRRFKGGEIPTSSMADIAFLLLIFFLVTTTIDMDKGLGIVLPPEGDTIEIRKKKHSKLSNKLAREGALGRRPHRNKKYQQGGQTKNSGKRKTNYFCKIT